MMVKFEVHFVLLQKKVLHLWTVYSSVTWVFFSNFLFLFTHQEAGGLLVFTLFTVNEEGDAHKHVHFTPLRSFLQPPVSLDYRLLHNIQITYRAALVYNTRVCVL